MAPVIVDRRGHTLLLVLNRPAARNGATAEMASLVGDALHAAEADRSIRAVVLTGAGERSFCAGADLAGVARGKPPLNPDHPEWSFLGLVRQPVKVPLIAAVNGFALGGGYLTAEGLMTPSQSLAGTGGVSLRAIGTTTAAQMTIISTPPSR
ncbi:MAG: hypothetical protein QOI30_240 [Mycobacterium sp.]|jgi:crotonobetainyl-CoA hydratase|nr:hypothetical protein [Mycobacterium sp.]MDT7767255.1 hypothetical protein [Mycobacterium sp.]